jgi:hypothetical protein
MRKLVIGILLSGLWTASAGTGPKHYNLTVSEKAMVGSTELKPGPYRLSVEGSTAVFRDTQSREIAKAPVTVSTADRKYDRTEIMMEKGTGAKERIAAIELQGTKLKLEFSESK